MKRLWIVECQFSGGLWDICYFVAFTNFYDAHRIKKAIQKHLKNRGSNFWTKKRFRVREYIQKEKS